MVDHLANKVNRVDYKMTEYEIQVFFNIVNKIKYIDETWRKYIELKFVANTANELGLELTSVEKAYKDIYAASKNTTLEGKGVQEIFSAVTKASSVLGMSVDETEGALRALSQMISKSNVQSEELKGQLGMLGLVNINKLLLSINLLNCGKILFSKIFLLLGLDYSSNVCYNS